MISTLITTQKCTYVKCCNYVDSAVLIYCGSIKRYLNKEEAENPSKSRQRKYKKYEVRKS